MKSELHLVNIKQSHLYSGKRINVMIIFIRGENDFQQKKFSHKLVRYFGSRCIYRMYDNYRDNVCACKTG